MQLFFNIFLCRTQVNSGINHLAYTGRFGGTSHSCPVVAGVAALMLSINPNLTPQQVFNILTSTTDKVGGYTYTNGKCNQMGYGRVNAYAAVKIASCYKDEIMIGHETITGTEIWNEDVFVLGRITVEDSATLTITDTVKFAADASIIVHPGGKLIIDGGTLTSACDDQMWQGIQVWGTRTQSQLPLPNSNQQWQGTLELKNGAVIENALCAVALWRPDHYTTTGGILNARDATFRNNAKSIHALHYSNFSRITLFS